RNPPPMAEQQHARSHILVTGGAGFIGSHVTARLLERGDRVTCLDDFNDFYDPALKRANAARFAGRDDWRRVRGDIRDAALVVLGVVGCDLDALPDFSDPARKRANAARFAGRDDWRLVEGAIRDADLVDRLVAESRFDAIIHLAARAGVRPSLAEPILYEEV